MEWQKLDPRVPDFLMLAQDYDEKARYGTGWKVTDIFPVNVLGFQTHRDHFAIAFERADIEKRVRDFRDRSKSDSELRATYSITDNRDWHLTEARKRLEDGSILEKSIIKSAYRPFDDRWCLFDTAFMDYPRRELMDHVFARDNVQLLVPRQIAIVEWRHVLVAENVAESCAVSNKTSEGNYNFPLYRYPPPHRVHPPKSDLSDNIESFAGQRRIENIATAFRQWLDDKYEFHFSPEEVLGYIYAVLHAPTYRARYAEFLRIDFPRVPFPESADDFETLSGLGWALVQAHLLRVLPRRGLADFHVKGDQTVETVLYSPDQQAVAINKNQSFKPVPQAVWDFHIGGYQVLDKYLKSRKGRALSLDEINHVSAIADSLAFTIERMARIDEAYRAAFGR